MTGVPLEPLRSLPLKEQVVHQLTRLIEDGTLQPGQQLPSERELSEQLQVSRGTVREAVQFLQALGLLEIRHGAGTFVSDTSADPQGLRAQWRDWTMSHADQVHSLIEVRRGLESFAAELAAERTGAEGLATMAEALEQMADAVEGGEITDLVQSDVAFHHGLAAASGNQALTELTDSLGEQLVRERGAIWEMPGRTERSLREHREIYEAVRAGDGQRARASVIAHLRSVERDVDRLLSDTGDQRGD